MGRKQITERGKEQPAVITIEKGSQQQSRDLMRPSANGPVYLPSADGLHYPGYLTYHVQRPTYVTRGVARPAQTIYYPFHNSGLVYQPPNACVHGWKRDAYGRCKRRKHRHRDYRLRVKQQKQ
ncbi:unnamed protein product [Didymodactylos carnosus]|uniref:Uncharacterized protein n=1 Tax=Didymodactylos carnosus TaxID=1234261 RepID=A0A814MLM2_9BILA|nr:unnamed protein product [Didymodactylos carnosus]CAF1284255.1 unnamed protein product [Didymodactylos carnosus]CAF3846630.1 unnamed protein product [Didymodactylos carnosus]CAF4089177.1 unnamed protein product [Didymodactylos carnosus]